MRLLTKTQRRKHAGKQGFWRDCDLVQPPKILQDQTNKGSTPKHKKKKHRPCPARQQRNTFHTCHDSIGIALAICYTFPEKTFQSSTRIAYSRILVLPLKIRCFQGFQQNLAGCSPRMCDFRYLCSICRDDDALLTFRCSRVAARCNHRTFVASEPWFLGT
jgi:hypothetical protein